MHLNIIDFTGIDSPYEEPRNPDIILDTCNHSVQICAEKIIQFLSEKVIITAFKKE